MTRRGKIIAAVAASLILLVAGLFYTLLASEAGLNWLVGRINAQVPGELTFGSVRGTLGGPIQIDDVRFRNEDVEVRVQNIALDWNLWGLFAGVLRVNHLVVDGVDVIGGPAKADHVPVVLPEIRIPIRLSVGEFTVNRLHIVPAPDAPAIEIDIIDFEGSMFASKLDIDQLEVEAPMGAISTAGSVKLSGQYPLALEVVWSTRTDSQQVRGRGTLGGDLGRLLVDQSVEVPVQVRASGALINVLDTPQWDVKIEAQKFEPKSVVADWPLGPADVTLAIRGDEKQNTAQVQLRSSHSVTGPFELAARVAYANQRVSISEATIKLTDSDTRIDVRGDVALDSSATSPLQSMQFSGTWQQLRWPLRGPNIVMSKNGAFQVSGNAAQYAFQIDAPLVGESVPSGVWKIRGTGDSKKIELTDVQIAALNGQLHASGVAQWAPSVAWKLDVDGNRLDPGAQWPEWPGQLALKVHHEGALVNEKLQGRIVVQKGEGRIRDYPVALQLDVRLDGEDARLDRALLTTGEGKLVARGGVSRNWNLDVDFQAPKLAALFPELRGAAEANISLRGPRQQPRAEIHLSGDDIGLGKTTLERIKGDAVLDWNTDAPSSLKLTTGHVSTQALQFDSITVTGNGTLARHQLAAEMVVDEGGSTWEIRGGLAQKIWTGELLRAEMAHPRIGTWTLKQPVRVRAESQRVSLDRACWQRQDDQLCLAANWNANEASSAEVDIEQLPIQMLRPYLPERMAVAGRVSGKVRARYIPSTHALDAEIALATGSGELLLTDIAEDSMRIEYRRIEFNARANADGLSAATRFDLGPLGAAEGQVNLSGWRLDADMDKQALSGTLKAQVNDVGVVSRLVPALDDARGTVQANFLLGGTLSNPTLTGSAKLQNGGVAIPQIGIKLNKIVMEAHNTPENVIEFSAHAESGPGYIDVRGEFVPDKERGWPLLVEITGKNFEAVNLPEAWVLASPDLQLQIVKRRIDFNGVLAIPEARYAARDTSSAITPSSDVVVVGKETESTREEKWQIYSAVRFVFGDKVTFNGFGLKGKVRGEVVALEEPKKLTTGYGELQIVDATFNAYKIDLKVTRGRLIFAGGPINNPGIDARAVREAGTIREAAPKDENQQLRESSGIVVGALVRGTLRKLELTLFSDPPRDQADVLSLLLFGVPLGDATTEEGKALFIAASTLRLSGRDDTVRKIGRRFGIEEIRLETGNTPDQAALVLGRYLGPRLYVNYSVGLLSTTANVLRVRYRISDKWTLQSEQSDAESAADLLYTFEH